MTNFKAKTNYKKILKRTWHFIWVEDSLLSWIVNVILAFVLIKFIVYPGLGFFLGTTHPVVAVVSGSMEHNTPFNEWWKIHESYYQDNFQITRDGFREFPLRNGFNKGDIMVLVGEDPESIGVGEVIVYNSIRSDPIIHRVVSVWENDGYHFKTKGDNVAIVQSFEDDIHEDQIVGKAVLKIPFLGWVKITFVCAVNGFSGGEGFFSCMVK